MERRTWTFTFSESVENHRGMQILGNRAAAGFTFRDLRDAAAAARALGCEVELIDLNQALPAALRPAQEQTPAKQSTSLDGKASSGESIAAADDKALGRGRRAPVAATGPTDAEAKANAPDAKLEEGHPSDAKAIAADRKRLKATAAPAANPSALGANSGDMTRERPSEDREGGAVEVSKDAKSQTRDSEGPSSKRETPEGTKDAQRKVTSTGQVGGDEAWVLVVRGGLDALLGKPAARAAFRKETEDYENVVDKKAFIYGRVVNKHARWNLCFADEAQAPDYEAKKGRVIAFRTVPQLAAIRAALGDLLGPKAQGLKAELNYYYDISKCGIGWHGDTERRIVVGLRVGATMDLRYNWFRQGRPIGTTVAIQLRDGDLYAMSDKAVGWDWHLRVTPTLRHAAGAAKFLALPQPESEETSKKRSRPSQSGKVRKRLRLSSS